MENRYAALVKGPSAVFPRGFLWLIPLWYLVLVAVTRYKGRLPSWYALCALGATLLAVLLLIAVLSALRNNAFVADESGVLLGLRGAAQRRIGRRRFDGGADGQGPGRDRQRRIASGCCRRR